MVRGRGRQFVDLCLLPMDAIVEGLYQGRLNLLGVDPHPSAVPHIANDTGIPNGFYETIRNYALRMRRRRWSWRAAGLAGVADVFVDGQDWVGAIPNQFSGRPTEDGNVLLIDLGGTAGTPGIVYQKSTNGGMSYDGPYNLGTDLSITIGDLTITFLSGDSIPVGTLRLNHGGRGLHLNDLGAPGRSLTPGSSPAGDESILHELANQVGDCRIRLVTMREKADEFSGAKGMWWTREADGTVWRFNDGPWAWEEEKDYDETYWARGVIIIDNPPNIIPWEVLGTSTHYLGEPHVAFGTSAPMEWWNRLYVTAYSMKPAHIRVVAIILNFDSTKFNPNDPATCMQNDWYNPHKYDASGNVTLTRPIQYAYFSRVF
jgi:hypothetical protein